MLRFKILSFLLISSILLVAVSPVIALDSSLPDIKIQPDNRLFYSFKRLFENTIFFTKISAKDKMIYYQELTKKRMAELKYVGENKLIGFVQKSSERLSYQVGVTSDLLAANKESLKSFSKDYMDLLTDYKKILVGIRDTYSANSSYWLLVQQNIDSFDLNMEKIK